MNGVWPPNMHALPAVLLSTVVVCGVLLGLIRLVLWLLDRPAK